MILLITDYIKHLYLKFTKKRIDYDLYLQTKHWRKTRLKAIKRAKNRCSICSSQLNLEVHHSTYYDDNNNSILYWEKPYNLVVVCKRCHIVIHKFIYTPKSKREVS